MNVDIVFVPTLPANPDDVELDFSDFTVPNKTGGVSMPWTNGTRLVDARRIPWGTAQAKQKPTELRFADSPAASVPHVLVWKDTRQQQAAQDLRWGDLARAAAVPVLTPWSQQPARYKATDLPWSDLQRRAAVPRQLPWGAPAARSRAQELPWGTAVGEGRPIILPWAAGPAKARSWVFDWGGQSRLQAPPIVIPIPTDPTNPPLPPVPIRQVYIVKNTITLLRLPDLTPIQASSVTLDADWDSWSWTLQATLVRVSDMALLEPDADGPKVVKVALNGWPWQFKVLPQSEDEQFAKYSAQITGSSLSVELGPSYAAPRTYSYDTDMNAQQIALAELDGTGWSLTWNALDWLVPASTFSYSDKTPIEVLSQIAASIGGTVQSDPFNKLLTVQSRYPSSPSSWSGATPDFELPRDILTRKQRQYNPNPTYNRVFVAGQVNGVNVRVTRTGTAGDAPAPQVVDPLICAIDAGTARGRYVLDASGNKSLVPLILPLFPSTISPGLLSVGQLGQVDDATPWRGVVTGIHIETDLPNIWQTVTLERSEL